MTLPVFAVLGHPNEGKSSVVATLTEDDRVPISPIPGETTECRNYDLQIRDDALMRFVDTPGFQNPKTVLSWFQKYPGDPATVVQAFREAHANDVRFQHDCELLRPLEEHAGILFVVDGSRPMRPEDEAEMEVLRMTGLPRMAVINRKRDEAGYVQDWKAAFARSFNSVRTLDAHRSGFEDRMALFEALKTLNEDWQLSVSKIVEQLRGEQESRVRRIALEIEQLLSDCLLHEVREKADHLDADQGERLTKRYQDELSRKERAAHGRIRDLLRHHGLTAMTNPVGLVAEDLFSERVWNLLGLSREQFTTACVVVGASAGVGMDVALGGLTFGILTATGAIAGGLAGWFGGPELGSSRFKLPGPLGTIRLGRREIRLGLKKNPQLTFVLIDRALLYANQLLNWTHARRDPEAFAEALSGSLSREWSETERKVVSRWQQGLGDNAAKLEKKSEELQSLLRDRLGGV